MENDKIYFLVLLYAFESKDELYHYLTRVSKRYGVRFLQTNYEVIDKYLPIPHAERFGIQLRQVSQIDQHESGVNQIVKLSDENLVTVSDDCSMKLWKKNKGQVTEQEKEILMD